MYANFPTSNNPWITIAPRNRLRVQFSSTKPLFITTYKYSSSSLIVFFFFFISSSMTTTTINPTRIRLLKPPPHSPPSPSGPIIYWMFRDQRVRDNYALIHSINLANLSSSPIAVAFNLFPRFLNAHPRQICFMLRSLSRLRLRLRDLNIPFFFFRGEAVDTIPVFLRECGASALVMDFSPLRPVREWKREICERVGEGVRVYEVDAHNVVPVWVGSGKLEYGARTIRGKIGRVLPEYLVEFPEVEKPDFEWGLEGPKDVDWDELIAVVNRYVVVGSEWIKFGGNYIVI